MNHNFYDNEQKARRLIAVELTKYYNAEDI